MSGSTRKACVVRNPISRSVLGSLLLTCIALSSHLNSQAYAAEAFFSPRVTLGFATIDNITSKGSIGTGEQIGAFTDGQIRERNIDDITAGFGAAWGWRFDEWQIDLEGIWRYRTDWDVAIPSPSIRTVTNIFSDVQTTSLMLNLSRRVDLSPRWQAEVTAGFGVALNRIDSSYIERERPGEQPEQTFRSGRNEIDTAWTAGVSFSRAISERWRARFGYRFIELGDLRAGSWSPRAGRLYAEHNAQEVVFSIEREL
ncbi:MAG: porin family protein [Pseudomonadaceae bacterium]|nr:porin family protein [Pseudomonadaceae bacterium]